MTPVQALRLNRVVAKFRAVVASDREVIRNAESNIQSRGPEALRPSPVGDFYRRSVEV